mmetsp:Transcript_57608/g.102181  ORF Transcript_57608/g.102181 Transcript_57608/m.102181 type:complete len:523 (+) Transcript_57608:3-1571(+)
MLKQFGCKLVRRQAPVSAHWRCFASTTYEGRGDPPDIWSDLQPFWAGFHLSRKDFIARRKASIQELQESYSISEKLGEGRTSKVYRAKRVRSGADVAIKMINKSCIPDPEMLRNEVEIHKHTDHPHISRVFGTFHDDDHLYLLTELLEGGDLEEYLNCQTGGRLPEEDAMELFRQVISSVRYLHSLGIVHRDLKPANFLCSAAARRPSGKMIIKLTDFGTSASCGFKRRLTKRIGTDGFMAPEVYRGRPYTEKADIFSLGCVLHTLLTGRPPRRAKDFTYERNGFLLSHVSKEVQSLLDWLMQHRPYNRPSIDEVSLEPLLQSSGTGFHDLLPISTFLEKMFEYADYPLLKKAALVAMVSHAESDLDFLQSIEKFRSMGSLRSMNMVINAQDIHEQLQQELPDGRHVDVEHLIRKVGCNSAGSLSYSEWLAATADRSWYSDPARIDRAFHILDHDCDGMISEADLQHSLPSVPAALQKFRPVSREQFSHVISGEQLSFFTLQHMDDAQKAGRFRFGVSNAFA